MKHFIAILVMSLVYQISFAATKTATNKSTATLVSSCTISGNNINFGTLTPAATGYVNVTGTLNVLCSRSTTYSVSISFHADGSTNSNSNYNGLGDTWAYNSLNPLLMESHTRIMKGQAFGDKLLYDIFREPTYTSAFGDQQTSTGTGTGASQSINMYARMSSNQYVTPDNYSASVIVVLTY